MGELLNGGMPGVDADIEVVLRLLDKALATELMCVLRYRRHHFLAPAGRQAERIKRDFLLHSGEQQVHADLLAARIVQLGGSPDFDPAGLTGRSNVEYGTETSLAGMIEEDLLVERAGIDAYLNMIYYLRDRDPVTRRLFEQILATGEDHAEDLARMLLGLADASDPAPSKQRAAGVAYRKV